MVLGLLIYLSGTKWLPADDRSGAKTTIAPREGLSGNDWTRVISLIILIPVLAVALLTNQEIFNAYLVWGDQHFQMTFLGFAIPSSWLISLDAALSFSMLVAVALFWNWRSTRRGGEPDELGKMIIGSVFTMAGGMCLVMAALTQSSAKIGLFWPFMFHLLNSIGFAHILPVSLALFTKVAPKSINATVVGLYYLSFFIANAVVGWIGGLYSSLPTPTFWLIHVASAGVGLVAFVLFKIFVADRMTRLAT